MRGRCDALTFRSAHRVPQFGGRHPGGEQTALGSESCAGMNLLFSFWSRPASPQCHGRYFNEPYQSAQQHGQQY